MWTLDHDLPSVVIISIDVQDFLALDTQDPTSNQLISIVVLNGSSQHTQKVHIPSGLECCQFIESFLPLMLVRGCFTCTKNDDIILGRDIIHDC